MTIDELQARALDLAPLERAKLVQALIESLDGLPEADMLDLWAMEAARREATAQESDWIPAEAVFAEAQSRYR